MFISAKGIYSEYECSGSGFDSDNAAIPIRASVVSEEHTAPLNHLQHNRRVRTIHKIQ